MGTTTNRNYPYPEGSDPVDVPGDIQALAEAVDTDVDGLDFAASGVTFDDTGLDHFTGEDVQAAIAAGDTAVDQALAIGDSVAVLQVLQATKATSFSTTSDSFVSVPDLEQTITLSDAANKVLVILDVGGAANVGDDAAVSAIALGTTEIYECGRAVGTASTSQAHMRLGGTVLHSPGSVGPHTYRMRVRRTGSATAYVNRSRAADNPVSVSITVMEVAA